MDNEHVSPFYDYLAGAIAGKTSFCRNRLQLIDFYKFEICSSNVNCINTVGTATVIMGTEDLFNM